MKSEELSAGLREVDVLAHKEYRESLAQVATRRNDDEQLRLLRLGRLMGVMLKEPFAKKPTDLDLPSPVTRAYRSWELDASKFNDPSARQSWQYQVLDAVASDPEVIEIIGSPSAANLANIAQFERGYWGFLAISLRKYFCEDTRLREEIAQAAKRAGIDVKNLTPEEIVLSGGVAIGTILVQHIPALAMMGAPGIALLIYTLYEIGIRAFCAWAATISPASAHQEELGPPADLSNP